MKENQNDNEEKEEEGEGEEGDFENISQKQISETSDKENLQSIREILVYTEEELERVNKYLE